MHRRRAILAGIALAAMSTLAEWDLPGYGIGSGQRVFAPAGTPPDIGGRLNAGIAKVINTPDVREKLLELGAEPMGKSTEEFTAFGRTGVARWTDVVNNSGVKVD